MRPLSITSRVFYAGLERNIVSQAAGIIHPVVLSETHLTSSKAVYLLNNLNGLQICSRGKADKFFELP